MCPHLGIDISKLSFDASLLLNGKYKNKKFDNTDAGFEKLSEWLEKLTGKAIETRVCMEGTGKLWEPLAEYMHGQGFHVSVVNPLRIKGFAKSELRRSKTDVLDAELIARFSMSQQPTQWQPRAPEMKALRDRQRYIEELTQMRTQEMNRLKSGRLDVGMISNIQKHIAYLDSQIAALEAEIREIAKSHESLNRSIELLCSIVGVGERTAITFLSEIPSVGTFANSRALETFVGLTPRRFESGTSVRGRSRISKVGNSRLRSALFFPALAAMRSNPCMQEFVQRSRAAGKPGKVIVCAIMRKLVRLMYTILKSGKPFDPTYKSCLSVPKVA